MAENTYYLVGEGGIHVDGRRFPAGISNDKALAKACDRFPHQVKRLTKDEAEKAIAEMKAKAEAAAKAKAATPGSSAKGTKLVQGGANE